MESYEEAIIKRNNYRIEEEKKELEKNNDLIKAFIKHCESLDIELSPENFNYKETIGIVASYPNILNHLKPELIKDKEGLYSWPAIKNEFEVKPFFSGFLYADNFMGMAHPHFRNGFYPNNNWAPRFIELFWKQEVDNCEWFIALDNNRVRINVDDSMYMEKATWYGPPFKKTIAEIVDDVSKLVPPEDLTPTNIRMFFNDAYSLNVKWHTKENIKSFQAEAFQTEDETIQLEGSTYFPAHYVHAEYDLKNNAFRHFDGAVHYYTEEEYRSRRDDDFNYNAKHSRHIKTKSEKLFKINGNIPTELWVELTCQFMTQNPLMYEYFNGSYPELLEEMLPIIRKINDKREKGEL